MDTLVTVFVSKCFIDPMDSVGVEICTDKDVYTPGQILTGSVNIATRKPIAIDSIKARLYGDAVVHFVNKESYAFFNQRVFVNEQKELWHYSTVQEMLGMTTLDHNANRCEKGYLTGKSQFRFAFNLPYDLATSFSCPASPVVVKYSITVTLYLQDEILLQHEHAVTVVAPQMIARPLGSQSVVHSKNFPLTKGRSIFIECALEQAVLSSVGKLQAIITVTNRWKQSIKYVTLYLQDEILLQHEHAVTVVAPQMIARPLGSQSVVHSKNFPLTKGRSIFIECALEQAVLSSVGKLQAIITVTNRWKQSIKYVHMSILRKIEAVGYFKDDQSITDTKTVLINTTGVGLPSSKHKIAVGETYIFTSSFNVPALPPSMNVPGLLETSYMVNIAVGRAHNYVIASLRVPITIVTNIVDIDPVVPAQRGDLLIDLTPPTWKKAAPAIDLLA
ncbi:arrestin domain protein [Ostertagia ostertagi]